MSYHVWDKPDLTDVDWTAPAVDLMDELMERWYAAHGNDEYAAEEWAERQFARFAR